MKYLPCDQIVIDTMDAEKAYMLKHRVAVHLRCREVIEMIEDVERMRLSGTDGTDLLPYVLEIHEPYEPGERQCYELTLITILRRRAEFRNKMRWHAKRGRWAPFALR